MPPKSGYKQEYCQELIDFGDTGMSFNAFAGHIGVSVSVLYKWLLAYPEFLEAKKIFLAKSQLWWEKIGIQGMKNEIPFFNSAIWCFNMKNRFFWRDNIKFDLSKVNDEILLDLARTALEQIEKEKLEYYYENESGKNGGHSLHQKRLPQPNVSSSTIQSNDKERVSKKGK